MEEKEAEGGADRADNLPASEDREVDNTTTSSSSSSSSDDSSGDAMVIHGHMNEEMADAEAVECTTYQPLVDGPTLVAVQ